jgi:GT2 family glycosyltransferase
MISIVFAQCNHSELTVQAIASVKDYVDEIIVVDDCSLEEHKVPIRALEGVRLIELTEKSLPPKGFNIGWLEAKGDYIFIANNDIVVAPTTIPRMIKGFQDLPSAAWISGSYIFGDWPSCSRHAPGHIKQQMDESNGQNQAELFAWAEALDGHSEYRLATDSTFFVVSREATEKVGVFEPILYSLLEMDYSMRLHDAGMKMACCTNGIIWHRHHVTVVEHVTQDEAAAKSTECYKFLIDKWGDRFPQFMENLRT